jgi:hypothetical protein
MLIETIAFEIHNSKLGIHEEYLVESTEDNYEKILTNRFSRQIKFTKTFDFQFEKDENIPLSFIEFDDEIDMIDEMVGTF